MCSCRKALIRAIQVRTLRYDSRTLRRNHWVTSAISGSTAKAIAASRQSIDRQRRHDPDQQEDVAEDRHHAGGEQLVQDVDIRRHPRHQPADRVAVVVLDVDALQMPVDLHPHVEHDPLPGVLQRPGLQVLEREAADQHGEEGERRAARARSCCRARCGRRSRPSSGRAARAAASTRRRSPPARAAPAASTARR